jgi:hypothetical protein
VPQRMTSNHAALKTMRPIRTTLLTRLIGNWGSMAARPLGHAVADHATTEHLNKILGDRKEIARGPWIRPRRENVNDRAIYRKMA